MATKLSTIEYLLEQLEGIGSVSYKKMFGEYLIYLNCIPIFLICDDTVFVKVLPVTDSMMKDGKKGFPYNGAKEHYIVEDIDNREFLCDLALALEKVIPLPKSAKKKMSK